MAEERNTAVKPTKKYVVLSIDGGGIRGLIPATVLVKLEEMIQRKRGDRRKIGDSFDFIAGTSTGGILTCLFLAPDGNNPSSARFSARQARDLYLENGDKIFDRSVRQIVSSVMGVIDEKYNAAALEQVLMSYLEELTLKDLIKPCLITGFDVRMYRPVFFTQHDAGADKSNYLVRDIARATSAAPTYFQPAIPESRDTIPNATPVVDGGVFANNPSVCAFVEVLKKGRGVGHGVPIEEIVILSLGTGRKPETFTFKQCKDWGLAEWARPLIDILMEGVSQAADYQMRSLFESMGRAKDYLRIDGEFKDYKNHLDIEGLDPGMDYATKENMERLCVFGEQLVQNHQEDLETFVEENL